MQSRSFQEGTLLPNPDYPDMVQNGPLAAFLQQQIETNRDELIGRYQKSLMATLFTNRSDVRPNHLRRIAEDEINILSAYLQGDYKLGLERGERLCQIGLSAKSVLAMDRTLREFIGEHISSDQVGQTFALVGPYQVTIIEGFMHGRERTILEEQEQIRKAFEQTISRFTIEIKEVQNLAQRATEANEFKSRFIARISHELRTPLGAILGMSEMLQHNIYGPLTAMQEDIIQRIVNNVRSLERIFSEFLDQSQIETGHLRLKEAPFSPQILAHTVYSTCLPLALQKGLSMHLHVDPDLTPVLIGDSKRIEQILNNLVVNAIKYTETGSIDVEIGRHNSDQWRLCVKDTGIGMSKESLAYIFEPFRQIDESDQRKHGGVGLGLSIVQELVTLMNGTVNVENALGRGSQFTVLLPMQTDPAH